MKYIKLIVIFCFCMCLNMLDTKALSCSNSVSKDLGQIASYVKVDYDVVDNSETKTLKVGENETTYFVPNFTFQISVYNITDEISVTVNDKEHENSFNIRHSETTDGVYTFENKDFGEIYNYEIVIKSENSGCYGEKVRTINFVKPKYNAYSEYTYCKNSSNYYCQKFTEKELGLENTDDFLKKITVNNEKNAPKDEKLDDDKTILALIKENWVIYLSVFAGVVLVLVGVILYLKKKQAKKGWEL